MLAFLLAYGLNAPCAGAVGLPMNILEQPSIGFRPAAFLSGTPLVLSFAAHPV